MRCQKPEALTKGGHGEQLGVRGCSHTGQKIQTSSYKINSGDLMYSMMAIVNSTVLYT